MFSPKLSQIANRNVITLNDDASLQKAAECMHQHGLQKLVIRTSNGLRILTVHELMAAKLDHIDFSVYNHLGTCRGFCF